MAVVLELRRVGRAPVAKESLELGHEGSATRLIESRRQAVLLLSHQAIDAPDTRASGGHVEKCEAEHRRTLAHVHDREWALRERAR